MFAEPTCAPLGALSLIGSSNYNHLLFTVSLYRIGVLGFWGSVLVAVLVVLVSSTSLTALPGAIGVEVRGRAQEGG